jgi:hypothetical protein
LLQPNKVPNYHSVSSDPNLIFIALCDHSGGYSTNSIEEETTAASFELVIDSDFTFSSDTVETSEHRVRHIFECYEWHKF